MASAELSHRVEKVVSYPPLSELDDHQRREFHEALLERRDIDRAGRVLSVRRTISSGEVVELGRPLVHAGRCRSSRALAALDALPPRLDTPFLFPARAAGLRPRQLPPPRVGARDRGVRGAQPARIYDLRSTFASSALAAGVSVFELARIMGTSVAMIERHYGTLIEGAGADIARRLTPSTPRQRGRPPRGV